MTIFAFECYADQDVFLFLREGLHLPLKPRHSFSQGEVINDVLVRGRAHVGMVDEDPNKPHHRARDQAPVVSSGIDVDLRRSGNRHLLIVKPDLETCFFRAMDRVGLQSGVANGVQELHRILGVPNPKKHADFRNELKLLYEASRARSIATFLTELEGQLATLPPAP